MSRKLCKHEFGCMFTRLEINHFHLHNSGSEHQPFCLPSGVCRRSKDKKWSSWGNPCLNVSVRIAFGILLHSHVDIGCRCSRSVLSAPVQKWKKQNLNKTELLSSFAASHYPQSNCFFFLFFFLVVPLLLHHCCFAISFKHNCCLLYFRHFSLKKKMACFRQFHSLIKTRNANNAENRLEWNRDLQRRKRKSFKTRPIENLVLIFILFTCV